MPDSIAPRRRLTATPPVAVPEAAPRSRRRVTGAADPTVANPDDALRALALQLYNAKVLADQSEADYKALRTQGLLALVAAKRTEFTMDAEANRPAFQIKKASKTINTIDPAKFQKMVSAAEFLECVNVSATDAKRFVGESKLDTITTSKDGATYLDCRVKGKAR